MSRVGARSKRSAWLKSALPTSAFTFFAGVVFRLAAFSSKMYFACSGSFFGGAKMRAVLAALPGQVDVTVRTLGAAVGDSGSRAYVAARDFLVVAIPLVGRVLKRGLIGTLQGLEAVLLSAPWRERLHAAATFALIFLLAVTSVDFLISGGPEFGAPARIATAPVQASNSAPLSQTPVMFEASPPTEVAPELAETTAATVVELSQRFEPRPAAAPPTAMAEAANEGSLAGEAPAAAPAEASEPATPRKGGRAKD
jgi:hypothetical protein